MEAPLYLRIDCPLSVLPRYPVTNSTITVFTCAAITARSVRTRVVADTALHPENGPPQGDTQRRGSIHLGGTKTRRVGEPPTGQTHSPPAQPAPCPEAPPMRLRAPGRAAPGPARPPPANDSPLAALPSSRRPGLRAQAPGACKDRGLGVRAGWRPLRPGSHLPGRRCSYGNRADSAAERNPLLCARRPTVPRQGAELGVAAWSPHQPPAGAPGPQPGALT